MIFAAVGACVSFVLGIASLLLVFFLFKRKDLLYPFYRPWVDRFFRLPVIGPIAYTLQPILALHIGIFISLFSVVPFMLLYALWIFITGEPSIMNLPDLSNVNLGRACVNYAIRIVFVCAVYDLPAMNRYILHYKTTVFAHQTGRKFIHVVRDKGLCSLYLLKLYIWIKMFKFNSGVRGGELP